MLLLKRLIAVCLNLEYFNMRSQRFRIKYRIISMIIAGFIEKSLIEGHAAFCGQDDDLPDLNASNRHLTVFLCLVLA